MEAFAIEYLDRLFGPFLNPQKRIFIGYLLSALLIALTAHLIMKRTALRGALSEYFARHVWLSRSAIADYKLLMLNQAIMMGVAPRLLSKLVLATLLFEGLHLWFNGRVALMPGMPAWGIAALFTFALFVLDDATKYLVHRALHRWPTLWCFHQVHHTAEVLTPFTVYRTHPVEAIIFAMRSILIQAVAIAIFLFFFGERASLVTVLGANIFLFVFNVAGSNLRHSHVWISYGSRLERWLISPAQHQIHHSVDERHFDRNFGAVLAVWDWIGGSLCIAEADNRPSAFGVEDGSKTPHSIPTLYLKPFVMAATELAMMIKRMCKRLRPILAKLLVRWSTLTGLLLVLGFAMSAFPLFRS